MAWYLFMYAACNVEIYQLNELLENKALILSAWYTVMKNTYKMLQV